MALSPVRFTVRKKCGSLGGQTLEGQVAEFNWELFKNTPNAAEFVRKAYFAAAQKLIRDIHENKNQTEEHHLQSIESLIARSLKFTKEEIEEWCESRDWARAKFSVEPEKGVRLLKEHLPGLSSSDYSFPEKLRTRAAEIVAEVADSKADPVADFLFVKLSQQKSIDELLLSI